MAGNVDLPGKFEWVVGFLVSVVCLECAFAAVRMIIIDREVAVIDGDEQTGFEGGRGFLNILGNTRTVFRGVAIRNLVAQ